MNATIERAPHDPSAESAVIGALILSKGQGEDFKAVIQMLKPDDFYLTSYKETYRAILEEFSAGQPLDLVTLKDALVQRRVFGDKFSIEDLARTFETVPTAAHAVPYAKIVRTKSAQRRVVATATAIADKAAKGSELNGEQDQLAEAIKSIGEAIDPIEDSIPTICLEGLDLGKVDWFLEPLFGRGLMTFISGKPKGGKSTFALYCALAMAKGLWISDRFSIPRKSRGIYLHYEDNLRRVQDRLFKYNKPLMCGPLPPELRVFNRPPRFDLTTATGISTLRKLIERDKAEFVILDVLAKCHSASENDSSEMIPVMTALRDITIDYNVSMIIIHHVRKTSNNGDAGGMTDKMRGSSSIAGEADVILDWGNRVAPNLTYCQLQSKEEPGSDEWNVRYIPQPDSSIKWLCESVTDREDAVEIMQKITAAIQSLANTGTKEAQFSEIKPLMAGASEQSIRNYLKLMSDRNTISRRRADELPRKPWVYGLPTGAKGQAPE